MAFARLGTFLESLLDVLNYFVWLRITDEGSVREMYIWSILLVKSDLKWFINLIRSLILYTQQKRNAPLRYS